MAESGHTRWATIPQSGAAHRPHLWRPSRHRLERLAPHHLPRCDIRCSAGRSPGRDSPDRITEDRRRRQRDGLGEVAVLRLTHVRIEETDVEIEHRRGGRGREATQGVRELA